jgi:dolichol-phosphate mannosyltransferase
VSSVTSIRGRSAAAPGASPVPRLGRNPWLRLWLVGLTGVVVNQAALIALTEAGRVHYLVSAVLATLVSTTWNYAWADRWVFGGRETRRSAPTRYLAFLGLNLASQPVRLPVLWALVSFAGLHYAIANLASLAALALARAVIADRWVWAPAHREVGATETVEVGAELPHHYAIEDQVRIASAVRLPELEWFRAEPSHGAPDIVIRVGWVGVAPTRRIRFEREGDRLVYREHLGALGANFSLRMGDPIEIVVAPLLARSPHVVYTNIVEAFLRFLLVSRGSILLHAACIANEHGATLISARTDTGKTSTVISLVRRHGFRFLSDDMTIVTPGGEAIAYPKPMTLSFHTLGAARGGRMSLRERMALSVQSRLHSKSGREVGRALGGGRLPIMTMNAIVQALVPPPKYAIDRLFPCRVGGRARIDGVVLIERGEPELCQQLSLSAALSFLIENTDDAYGFPPFATFAPRIEIDGRGYEALRLAEREAIERVVARIERWQLRDPSRSWADQLPNLLAQRPEPEPEPDLEPAARPPVPVMAAPTAGPAWGWVAAEPTPGVAPTGVVAANGPMVDPFPVGTDQG